MSKRIAEILHTLAGVYSRRHWVGLARAAAVADTARHFRVNRTSVHTKIARELTPCIDSIEEFDKLVLAWLCGHGDELRRVLTARSVGAEDRAAVERFFNRPGWESAAA